VETVVVFALSLLTLVHVIISLAGIAAGLVVVGGLLAAKPLDGWTAGFLGTTALTSVTGFFFPRHGFTPGQALGVLSLVCVSLAVVARYRRQLAGPWRTVYVICALISLYFDCFVLLVQLFQKVPALVELAPTQSEPPFVVTQAVVLAIFVAATIACVVRFRGGATRAGPA